MKGYGYIAALVVSGSSALAQTSVPVAEYRVGDNWSFSGTLDGRKIEYTETVTGVFENVISVRTEGGGRVHRRSRSMNYYDVQGNEIPFVRFPLTIGASWEGVQDWHSNGYSGRNRFDFKVVGEEQVRAGDETFQAFKITADGWQSSNAVTGSKQDARISYVYWYAPAVKRIVKFDGEVRNTLPYRREIYWENHYQLTRYVLATP